MPSLRIEIRGQTVVARLGDLPVRVGRDPSCDLRVDHPEVSARHASIEPLEGGGHKLLDLRSGLPTKVNGAVVQRVLLRPGDVIEVGPARITYLAENAEGLPAPYAAPPVPAAVPAPVPAARPVAPARVAVAPAVPVAVARVESPAVAAVAEAAPAPAAVAEVSAPAPAVAAAPAAAPAASAGKPVARVASPREASTRRLRVALALVAGFAVAALGLAAILRGGGDATLDLKALKLDLDRAKAMASEDVDGSLALLGRLAKSPVEGIRREAESEIAYLSKRREQADRDVADLLDRAARLDEARFKAELSSLEEKHGVLVTPRRADLVARAAAAHGSWVQAKRGEIVDQVGSLVAEGRFSEALGAWDAFEGAMPVGEETRRLVEDGKSSVEAKAGDALAALAGHASEVAHAEGPRAAATLLRSRLPAFAGTASAAALAMRAAEYDREAASTSSAARGPSSATPPSSTTPSRPTSPGSGPAPTPATPPAPAAGATAHARLESSLAQADAKAGARRFAEAISVLEEAAKGVAGTSDAPRVAARRDDLTLAREGLVALGRTVREHPDRFVDVEIAPKYVASLVDADEEFVTAAVHGGRTKVRWASFDAAKTAALVEAARLPGKDLLPLAALLKEAGAKDAAEKALLAVAEAGGDRASIDARLARWRGEPVPAGGYVAYEGRLVSPVERERLVLAGRIAVACARVGSRDAKERKAAYDELTALGAPAKEAFSKALRARREAATHELAAMKVFTSGKTRARLVQELSKRRAEALAAIEDEKSYPYPYPPGDDHPGQKEVDRLVDLVREVWERPFDLVASWDKSVEEGLALVREVDDVLAKVEDGYVADLDAVRAAVDKAVDVPGQVAEAYDKEVLAYNEKVSTTATGQEKENVRIVNAYRIMMGRAAVKLDERLVRAARGHSIEMARLGYFAHESPTPGLESPGKRVAREGYTGGVGENIAKGTTTARAAFDGWFHSSGHHRNMLGKHWTEMGTGRAHGDLWTQNFGGLTGSSLREPAPLPAPSPDVAPEKEDADGNPVAPGDGAPAGGEPGMGDGNG